MSTSPKAIARAIRLLPDTEGRNYLEEAIIKGKQTYMLKNLGANINPNDAMAKNLCKADDIKSAKDLTGKYTFREFENAVVSCASYAIYYVLHEMHYEIREAIKTTRKHRLCKVAGGFKQELIRLEGYDKSRETAEVGNNDGEMTRIKVMCKYVHEDLMQNRQRMTYTVKNWLNGIMYKDVDLLAPWIMAQIMTDFACNFIKERIEEVARYRPSYIKLMDIVPTRLNELVLAVEKRIVELVPDNTDKNINDSKELSLGIRIIEHICLDLEQMQYYCGAGLEAEMGAEQLKKESPKVYYLIHPMEDPAWEQEKARRDLEKIEQEEKESRAGIEYSSKDVSEYEEIVQQDVKVPLTMEKAAELKGWKLIRK